MKYKHERAFTKGYNAIIESEKHAEMKGMAFGIVKMDSGDISSFCYPQETVYDLLYGEVEFKWEGGSATAKRRDCFHKGAQVLHVPSSIDVKITCLSEAAEVAVCRVPNTKNFPAQSW